MSNRLKEEEEDQAIASNNKKARTRTPLTLSKWEASTLKTALLEDFNHFDLDWEDEPRCTRLRCTICYSYWIVNSVGPVGKRQAKFPFVGIIDPIGDPVPTSRTPAKWLDHQKNSYHREAVEKGGGKRVRVAAPVQTQDAPFLNDNNTQQESTAADELPLGVAATILPDSEQISSPQLHLHETHEKRPKTSDDSSSNKKPELVQTARFSGPSEHEMSLGQLQLRQEIIASRPGTGLSGPFGPWLSVPAIARPAQALGKVCRYDTSLSFRESELVILLTGAKTKSHTEFEIHTGEALRAGLTMELIRSIPRDDNFSLARVKERVCPRLETERERAIVTFAAELLDTSTMSDQTYKRTRAKVGHKDSVLVEITSIVGYYTFVAYTLNVFRIPP
ncbi:hypothetical protein ACA910_007334 [Epithemia clementina (nom. ined.)]